MMMRTAVSYTHLSVSETGDGVEDADGSSQMSAEFVYQNGSYQLRSVNPGNIWYKQLQ